MKVSDYLKECKALIQDPEKWSRKSLFVDENGRGFSSLRGLPPDHPGPARRCAVGALVETAFRLTEGDRDKTSELSGNGLFYLNNTSTAIKSKEEYGERGTVNPYSRIHSCVRVNDHGGHQATMDMYDEAILAAEITESLLKSAV